MTMQARRLGSRAANVSRAANDRVRQTHRLNPGRANGQFRRVSPAMDSRIRWLKIKNPDYSQNEGSGELFNRERPAHSAR
jgi:hypothetical protein